MTSKIETLIEPLFCGIDFCRCRHQTTGGWQQKSRDEHVHASFIWQNVTACSARLSGGLTVCKKFGNVQLKSDLMVQTSRILELNNVNVTIFGRYVRAQPLIYAAVPRFVFPMSAKVDAAKRWQF